LKQKAQIDTTTFIKALLVIPSFIAAQGLGFGVQEYCDRLHYPALVGIMSYSLTFIGLLLLFIYLLFRKILHIHMSDFRIGKITLRPIIVLIGIALPVFVIMISTRFQGAFIRNSFKDSNTITMIIQSLFYTGLSAGITEELVFRGVLMSALEKRFNKFVAVIAPSLLFGLGHVIGRELSPLSIVYLILAGTSVGIMFSLVVYATGSIWNSIFLHTVWNIFMTGNILILSNQERSNAIYTYLFKTNSFLITGGDFGIEASLTSVIGYWIVCLLALFIIKKNLNKHHFI
jgi:membrane protease YdiL (CAAX protease family)